MSMHLNKMFGLFIQSGRKKMGYSVEEAACLGGRRGRPCSGDCSTVALDGRRPSVQQRATGNNGLALPGCLGAVNLSCRRPGPSGALAAGTQTRISSPQRKEVSEIKKKEGTGIKRVNVNIPTELHNSFKAATAAQGLEMTIVLLEFIEDYVAKNGPATPKQPKSRHA